MAETLCKGTLHRETEFALVSPGVRVFGACGPNALAEVASNALNKITHTSDVYWLMRNAGLCDSQGISTLASIATAAGQMGLKQVAYRGYTDPPWSDWQALFQEYAGAAPFVAQVGWGQQLVDVISGEGENANDLHSHFICVLGRNTGGWSPHANQNLPAGYWVADGCSFAGGNNNQNNFNAADVLQFYPDDMMNSAQPTGALVIQGATAMAWTRDNTGAHDDKGHHVGFGIADAIFAAGYQGTNGLQSETYYDNNNCFAPLSNGQVAHWSQVTQQADWNGAIVTVALWQQIQALKQQIAQNHADELSLEAIKAIKAALQVA